MPPVLPMATGAVVGILDGVIFGFDEKSGRATPPASGKSQFWTEWQTYYRLAMPVVGLIADRTGHLTEDVNNALVISGLYLNASRFAHAAMCGHLAGTCAKSVP